MTRRPFLAGSLVPLALFALLPSATLAVDVSTCGIIIPAGEVGTLTNDLTCPPDYEDLFGWAVWLKDGATLELAGHTVSGSYGGVLCNDGRCLVRGPGVISTQGEGVTCGPFSSRVAIEDLTLSGHSHSAVESDSRTVRLSLRNVTVTGDSHDLSIPRGAINGVHVRAENVTATGNFQSVFLGKVRATGLLLDGNHSVFLGKRAMRMENSTIVNSTSYAIQSARAVRLENVTLANNDTDGEGIDILTAAKPRLTNSTCSRSQKCDRIPGNDLCTPVSGTWRVCVDDVAPR